MREVQLVSGPHKEIEHEIVEFYKTVGRMINQNTRATEVFAYLRIYDSLSQEQLRQLTGFSLSTISSILQVFLQVDIVSRDMIPGTHKNLYQIKPERVKFDCNPPTLILEDLESLDMYIEDKQRQLDERRGTHPLEVEFLHRRLNSIRNYIEAQRRQISGRLRHSFFKEDVSGLIPLDEMVVYPFDTSELEEKMTSILSRFKGDPLRGKILGYFFTRRSLDQQSLVDLSGLSRSTVSRFLHEHLKGEYIRALPREHRKPRIYYLEWVSLSMLTVITKADEFIYSYAPRFQQILDTLTSQRESGQGTTDVVFLIAKLKDILRQIEAFKKETRPLRKAREDLREFLGRESTTQVKPD